MINQFNQMKLSKLENLTLWKILNIANFTKYLQLVTNYVTDSNSYIIVIKDYY